MKGMYVIAIAFLASWAVSAADQLVSKGDAYADGIPTICPVPEEFPENTTTNLPHETSCIHFYKCHMGARIQMICPLMTDGDDQSRLHYNRRLQVCDWPWQAGCDSCPRKDRNGRYPPPSKINDPANNCQYIECDNGNKYPRYCPSGMCFSRTCQECVWNRAGGYCPGGNPTPTATPTIPTPTPRCQRDGETRPHECDCAKYYKCYNSDEYVTPCEGGLHYSPRNKICMPPNEAGCLIPSVQ